MREVIIRRLEAVDGLIIRTALSSDESYIVCVIRTSRNLLFDQAQRCHVRLPIWPEVDPGPEVRCHNAVLQ